MSLDSLKPFIPLLDPAQHWREMVETRRLLAAGVAVPFAERLVTTHVLEWRQEAGGFGGKCTMLFLALEN